MKLQEGTVLILSGTLTPETVPLHLKPYWASWRLVGNSNGHVLDQDLRMAAWSFFFIGGTVRGFAIGPGSDGAVNRAMRSVLNRVAAAGYNCAQVSDVAAGRFLGIPYVRVAVHPRHLQKNNTLGSLKQRSQTMATGVWCGG